MAETTNEEEIPQQRHYSTAAAKKRNFLIHAYYNIDAGTPFESEREFQDLIKSPLAKAIYACAKASGLQHMDHELLVEDFTYKRQLARGGVRLDKGIGIIKCLTAAGSAKIRALCIRLRLEKHIAETARPNFAGMYMNFRRPQVGPDNIGELLEMLFAANNLQGSCGGRSERLETPS
jgi:hypothetical protein